MLAVCGRGPIMRSGCFAVALVCRARSPVQPPSFCQVHLGAAGWFHLAVGGAFCCRRHYDGRPAGLYLAGLGEQSRHGDRLAGVLHVETARASLVALAVGVVVGCLELVIFWLADDRHFWRAVASVAPGRLWFALAELIFFALCMAGYLWLAGPAEQATPLGGDPGPVGVARPDGALSAFVHDA